MDQPTVFLLKYQTYLAALNGFKETLAINTLDFDSIVQDAIRNGSIQKFEYCSEMTWKLIREYLILRHGIEANSTKENMKKLLVLGVVSDPEYQSLMDMIDDRNRLSHIYKKNVFEEIHTKLPAYYSLMEKISFIIRPGQ